MVKVSVNSLSSFTQNFLGSIKSNRIPQKGPSYFRVMASVARTILDQTAKRTSPITITEKIIKELESFTQFTQTTVQQIAQWLSNTPPPERTKALEDWHTLTDKSKELSRHFSAICASREQHVRLQKQHLQKTMNHPFYDILAAMDWLLDDVKLEVCQSLEGDFHSSCALRLFSMLQIFIDAHSFQIDAEGLQKLQRIQSQLEFFSHIATRIDAIVPLGQDVNGVEHLLADIIGEIQAKIHQMQPGDELILPGGYDKYPDSGHSVLFRICCTNLISESGLECDTYPVFSFMLDNTGEGSASLPPLVTSPLNAPDNYCCEHVLTDITLKKLLSVKLWEELFAPQVRTQSTKDVEEIKKQILTAFGKETFKKGKIHPQQVNENCGFSVIRTWMEEKMGDLYLQFDIEMKERSINYLSEFCQQCLREPYSETSRQIATLHGTYQGIYYQGHQLLQIMAQIGEQNFIKAWYNCSAQEKFIS